MKRTWKRSLSVLLALVMLLSSVSVCLPVSAVVIITNPAVDEAIAGMASTAVADSQYGRSQLAKMPLGEEYLRLYDGALEAALTGQGEEEGEYCYYVPEQERLLTVKDTETVMQAFFNDHPELFWIESYSTSFLTQTGKVGAVGLNYNDLYDAETINAFNTAVRDFLADFDGVYGTNLDEYHTALYLHDYLGEKINYDDVDDAHNAYGALMNKVALCEGYTELYNYLLGIRGIWAHRITGYSAVDIDSDPEAHAWSMVRLDGEYYHVDATWDDWYQTDVPEDEAIRIVFHPYFAVTEDRIKQDHKIDNPYHIPDCTATEMNYFVKEACPTVEYPGKTEELIELFKSEETLHLHLTGEDYEDFTDYWLMNFGTEDEPYYQRIVEIAEEVLIAGTIFPFYVFQYHEDCYMNLTGNRRFAPTAPAKPTVKEITSSSVELNTVDGCEYRCGETGKWQTSPLFRGLVSERTYTFYQRVAATGEVWASEESDGVNATTKAPGNGNYGLDEAAKSVSTMLKPDRSAMVGRKWLAQQTNAAALLKVYDAMVKGADNFDEVVYTNETDRDTVTEAELFAVWEAYENDHGEQFWVNKYAYRLNTDNDTIVSVQFYYDTPVQGSWKEDVDTFKNAVQSFFQSFNATYGNYETLSDYEKALGVHDMLCSRITPTSAENTRFYNVYGALVQNTALGQGTALLYSYLMEIMGMEATRVKGSVGDASHYWNLVKMDGNWYQVDVTLDDQTENADARNRIMHQFFGFSDPYFAVDHTVSTAYTLPACTHMECNWFVKNDWPIMAADKPATDELIRKFKQGESVTLYLTGDRPTDFAQWWMHNAGSENDPNFDHAQPVADAVLGKNKWYAISSSAYGRECVLTLKGVVPAPDVYAQTATSLTLATHPGYEYSMDGVQWQTSSVFSGLTEGNTYTFYQRELVKGSTTEYNVSPGLTVVLRSSDSEHVMNGAISAINAMKKTTAPDPYYGRNAVAGASNGEEMLKLYDAIVSGANQGLDTVYAVSDGTVTIEEMEMVWDAYINDHPEQFWVSGYSYARYQGAPCIVGFNLTYTTVSGTVKADVDAFNSAVDTFLNGYVDRYGDYTRQPEYMKSLNLHEWLCEKVSYEDGANVHSVYGALVDGKAVCDGYAEAYQYLLGVMGVFSHRVVGFSRGENHAWNLVKWDGEYYYVDATWDDQTGNAGCGNRVYHMYFGLNDDQIGQDHTVSMTYALPDCTATRYNYFTYFAIPEVTVATAVDTLAQELKKSVTVHVHIDEADAEDFVTWWDTHEGEVYANINAVAEEVLADTAVFTTEMDLCEREAYITMTGLRKAPAKPTVAQTTVTSVALTPVDGMEYSMDGTHWQLSNVFTDLTPGTTYTFYQRVASLDSACLVSSAGTEYKLPEFTGYPGDVDGNGVVDAKDLTKLCRHVSKIEYITDPTGLLLADVDGSGVIDAKDLTKLCRHVAKIELMF